MNKAKRVAGLKQRRRKKKIAEKRKAGQADTIEAQRA